MKLQLCAEIEGHFLLKSKVEAKRNQYDFEIFEKEGKYFISITKPVKNYMDYAPKLYVKDGVIHIKATKPEIYKDMAEWLYYIEAMGAFNFEVTKIHIDELEVKWIYETEEEKGSIPITSLKRNKKKHKASKYLSDRNLLNLILFRKMLPEAHIPFSYYRQAKTFFDNDNYYFAFINYFMMLEFCFADGHFHKKDVINSFKKSILLKLCVLSAISMIKNDSKVENYKWLMEECKVRHKDVNFESVIYLLIEYRGLLSHASERSNKYLFDNYKLRPLAFITSVICFLLCEYIQVYSCSSKEDKQRLISEKINKLEQELFAKE
ncbi:hypothetical protein [Marseilla massiliensis]|uniref:Uncharacterized protein n=1 Tax=Marseilla massiliensis TaxID=1841864 RepID=A0A938WKH0_9BACT|nr:hypothetical protein [Marseilla massiliensis]MBM6660185.1 hypothetical protein [Marseilla massiliensis]